MSVYLKTTTGATNVTQPYTMGESTYWIYRKWYNGYIELWNKYYEFSYTTPNQSGSIYFMSKDNWGTELRDVTLTSVIGLYATINSRRGEGLAFPCIQSINITEGQLRMTLFICSPAKVTTARNLEVMCYSLCKWK